MPERLSRLQLYETVWSQPLIVLARRFNISDVALKKTCARFDIPVPARGYWAKLQAGKSTTKVALPARAAGMNNEVVVGGRNHYWHDRLTDEEILGALPAPPTFTEDLSVVRNRGGNIMGKVRVGKDMTAY